MAAKLRRPLPVSVAPDSVCQHQGTRTCRYGSDRPFRGGKWTA